jgi:hypothetical protein
MRSLDQETPMPARLVYSAENVLHDQAPCEITSGYILRIPERICKYLRRSMEWRILTCPKSVSVHPPNTALLECQFTACRNNWALDSPVLLTRRGNLLHLAHALVVRDFVVVVAAGDLVLAWNGTWLALPLSSAMDKPNSCYTYPRRSAARHNHLGLLRSLLRCRNLWGC